VNLYLRIPKCASQPVEAVKSRLVQLQNWTST
jgi:hypothetical protein